MNWHKLNKDHYFKNPVEHIRASSIVNTQYYDVLYENQNNLSHASWQEFDEKYRTGFQLHDDLEDVDYRKEVICLWFFKERNDRGGGETIDLAGNKTTYTPNTFLITEFKGIKIVDTKKRYLRRPVLQLDMPKKQYDDIVSNLR